MRLKPLTMYGAIVTGCVLATWYWFIYEPDAPFAVPDPKQILADPKVPPDPERPTASPEVMRADKPSGDRDAAADQAKCPPGDPMCGGL